MAANPLTSDLIVKMVGIALRGKLNLYAERHCMIMPLAEHG